MTLAEQTLQAARSRNWRIATAESCTGGMVASALTDIAGASDVFDRGFVTYSYASKEEMLGVSHQTLLEKGAVSREVASQMALGALKSSLADISVSITGVAGPGSDGNKPEGLVWFGVATTSSVITTEMNFGAIGRDSVRQASVEHALSMLLNVLKLPI